MPTSEFELFLSAITEETGSQVGNDEASADQAGADQASADHGVTRHEETHRRRGRQRLLVAGAVLAVGSILGTGLVWQTLSAQAESERVAATKALSVTTGAHPEQTSGFAVILPAHAAFAARSVLSDAQMVMEAGQGKTDITSLSSAVTSLAHYTVLEPERVFDLVDQTRAETATVRASTAEVDRVAAEQAAKQAAELAAKQAAEQAAAAQAAAAQAAA
ncbi:hypothetical protein, partial [Cryobacterium sp. TMT4-10]